MASVMCDYLTVTHSDGAELDAIVPYLWSTLSQGTSTVNWKHRTGARGWRCEGVFLGAFDDGRLIVEVSGFRSHALLPALREFLPKDGLSVARMDVQCTVAVEDADAIIKATIPNKRYKSSLITNLWDKGATLYVGAPSSDKRLRVYNKSAESGHFPASGGEWLRVELQLRNDYADRMWRAFTRKAENGTFLEIVRTMADNWLYRLIRDYADDGSAPVWDEDTEASDWVERRMRWIEQTIVPALRRLLVAKPELYEQVVDLLGRALYDGSTTIGESD